MTYKAVITGHTAPFRWKVMVQRVENGAFVLAQTRSVVMDPGKNGGTNMIEKMVDCSGEAPNFDDAMSAAEQAAQDAEFDRQHAATVYEEVILEVEEPEPLDIPTA